MSKYTDENGNEVEALTQQEVLEREEKLKNEYETKMSSLVKEKEELEGKINGTKEDHPNFKILREALDKKDGEIKGLKIEITDFATKYNEDQKNRKAEIVNSMVSTIAKGNKEFEDKIKFHLENTLSGMKGDTQEEINKKFEAAVKLSSDNQSQSPLDSIMHNGTGAGNYNPNSGSSVEFSSREKALGAKLGISEEDYKKYGPRLSNK